MSALGSPTAVAAEELSYRWRLGGVGGTLARIFVPGKGEGRLSVSPQASGELLTELRITSDSARRNDFWSWGARLDGTTGRAVEMWNESHYKQREKRREAEAEGPGVIDIPSGIYRLRTDPPSRPLDLRLWTDGKIYPVRIEPGRRVTRKLDGERRELVYFSIEAREVPGERPWKGRLELWLTPDERSVPVEIIYRRDLGKVHLELVAPPG